MLVKKGRHFGGEIPPNGLFSRLGHFYNEKKYSDVRYIFFSLKQEKKFQEELYSKNEKNLIKLLEADFVSVFSEEPTADVHVVLSDDTIVSARNTAAP